MPSDKRNLIMAVPTGLISLLFNFSSSRDASFHYHSSSDTRIMVLPKLTFVLHLFLHHDVDDDLKFMCYGFSVSAMLAAQLAGALLILFFAWNVTQSVLSKL